METKHTKGEWNIETNEHHYPMIIGDDNNVICSLFDTKDGSMFYGRDIHEVQANVKLIAASPDLLEALTNLKNTCEKYFSKDFDLTEAINAIRKAT